MTAPQFRTDVLLSWMPSRALGIDLTHVDFLASAGLEVLVAARFTAAATMPVVVVANGPITRRPIEVTGIHELVTV
jgi:anti-sigma B factor antagonist